jgi:SAM-dependent methyltransferase
MRGRLPRLAAAIGRSDARHRGYVGGKWDEIGKLQFDFMVSRGLSPGDAFLDIACGSLRGGVHFIQYLDPGNYLGIDKERSLIDRGLSMELPRATRKQKRPEFVVSDAFEFSRFSKTAQYSLAQSLFTHLIPPQIELCLSNLRAYVADGHQAYATFCSGDSAANPSAPDDEKRFNYSREELAAIGERTGWRSEYIGEWGHPRDQLMMLFRPA